MADEVSGSVAGPNGERVQIQLGSKSIGITSRDLLMVAFVAGIFVFIWINSQSNRENLGRIATQQERTIGVMEQNKSELVTALHDQRTFLLDQIHQSRERLDAQTDVIRRMLEVHEANRRREPAESLPLEYQGEVGKPPPSR